MARWISLYWAWLLPALAMLATLARLYDLHRAHQRGLITARGWRWMLAGVAAAQAVIWLAHRALTYQTNVWLPVLGLLANGVMLLALRAARAEIHPGLHGLQRPLPRDGLELIEHEERALRRRARLGWGLRPWLPLLPAFSLLVYITLADVERWLALAALGMALAAPSLLTPYRRLWILPLLLTPPLMLLAAQASIQSARLPPGDWAAPLTGARCTGQLRVAAGRAWCVNALASMVYQFDLRTGVVNVEQRVPEGVRVFAANELRGWVQQSPARGLVIVDAHSVEPLRVLSAHTGAADDANRLWVIDVGMELSLFVEGEATPLRAKDGLLNNTANRVKVSPAGDVWVGSIGGVSWLPAGETHWRTLRRETSGLPGAVINFAFAPDGTVWLLWQARPSFGPRSEWGVSALRLDGSLLHIELGALTKLETPLLEDALAVDGLGRLWFATQSIPSREKLLGVVAVNAPTSPLIYPQGRFATSGPYAYGAGLWPYSFGVVSDGEGGIILYDSAAAWRHWRPGWP
jgi:sugar lactone lactonase YvrE